MYDEEMILIQFHNCNLRQMSFTNLYNFLYLYITFQYLLCNINEMKNFISYSNRNYL